MCKFIKILERAGGHKPQSAPVAGAVSVQAACIKLFDLLNKSDENRMEKSFLTKDAFSFLGDILSKNWDAKQNKMLMGNLDPHETGKVCYNDFEVTQ